jgi:type II secretory pathway pseudopilin PulG
MTDEQPPVLPRALGRMRLRRRPVRKGHDGRRRLPFAVVITSLIVGGMALLLVLNTASAANEVRRRDLAIKDAAVAAQVQDLRNEVAASAAPGLLAEAAAGLGMVPANNPAFLVLGSDGSVRIMGSPNPASGAPIAVLHKKKKKKKPSKTATPTKTPTSTSPGATTSTSPAGRSTSPGATETAGGSTSPSTTPTPTPTPTPTVTLPGGDR